MQKGVFFLSKVDDDGFGLEEVDRHRAAVAAESGESWDLGAWMKWAKRDSCDLEQNE